jgi:hypothetical protein
MATVAPASGFNAAMAAQPSMAVNAASASDTEPDGDENITVTFNFDTPATLVDLSADALLALEAGIFGIDRTDFNDAFLIASFFEQETFIQGAVAGAVDSETSPTPAVVVPSH